MSSHDPIKMLLIDDQSLTTSLDRAGYREMGILVNSASSSQQALQLLKTKTIDLVVVNLDYQQVNAPSLCQQIRLQSHWQNIPIVLTSVAAKTQIRQAAMEAGATLFVEQPIPRSYFIEKLKQLLTKETRENDRLPSADEALVKVSYRSEEFRLGLGDLSLSGMLIITEKELPLGSLLSLEFQLPSSKKPIIAEGEVVRLVSPTPKHPSRPHGLGVRFHSFQGDGEKRLQKHLASSELDSKQLQYYL